MKCDSSIRVLITGAKGFVGRNVTERFSCGTEYEVFSPGHAELDLLNDDDVKNFIRDNGIGLVIHCANIGGSRKQADTCDVVEKNMRMFFNIVRNLTPEMRMVHMGSGAEYDSRHYAQKMDESRFDAHVPADDYGFSKYLMSKYIEKAENIVCLRIFGLYGRYEDYTFKFISNAIVKNLLHLPIVINQNAVFDYLFIGDFLNILERVVKNEIISGQYNITPTESLDLISAAGIINRVSSFASDIKVLNDGINKYYTGDNRALIKRIGPFDFTSYEDGIGQLYDYYRSNLSSLDTQTVLDDPYLKLCDVKK